MRPKVLKCVMCNYANICRDKFVEHIVNVHETPENNRKRMSCQLCDFKTMLAHEMEEHTTMIHQNIEKGSIPLSKKPKTEKDGTVEFRCKSCTFVSNDQMEVAQHFIKLHIDKNIVDKKSEGNDKTFVSIGKNLMPNKELAREEKSIAMVKTDFKASKSKVLNCRRCEFKTSFRKKFAAHLAKKHRELLQENDDNSNSDSDVSHDDKMAPADVEKASNKTERKLFECRHCLFKTFNIDKLTGHMIKSHSELTPIKADSMNKDQDKAPLNVGSENRPINSLKCEQRNFTTNIRGKLKSHVNNKHRKEEWSEDSSDKENRMPISHDKSSVMMDISLSDAIIMTRTVKTAKEQNKQEAVGSDLERRSSRRLSKKLEKEKQEQSGQGPCSNNGAFAKETKSSALNISCRFCDFKTTTLVALGIHAKTKHAKHLHDDDDKQWGSIEQKNSRKGSSPGINSYRFKCSKCCTFTTHKLYLLAQHFGICSIPPKEDDKNDDGKPPKDGPSNVKVAPLISSNDCNQKADIVHHTSTSSTFTSLPKFESKSLTVTALKALDNLSLPCPESDIPKIEEEGYCKFSTTLDGPVAPVTCKTKHNVNDDDHNADDSKQAPVQPETTSGTTSIISGQVLPKVDDILQARSSRKDEIKPPESGDKKLNTRNYFCSKCSFSATSLKSLAFHYVTCNGKL